jgi:NTE family protein
VIGLALSGGGSRAIAFHLGCLRALDDLGLLSRIGVLSTISGGSVIGAYFAYSPGKNFAGFDDDVCQLLRRGLHTRIAAELAKPTTLLPCVINAFATTGDAALSFARGRQPTIQRYPSRTDIFQRVLQRDLFPGLTLSSPRRGNIEIVIGACELRTGTAFRFGDSRSGDWRHGEMVSWDVEVGFAAAASAAYPLLLPALDRTWRFRKNGVESDHRVLLTDGGVYDNLGLQVLEPARDPGVSLHTFGCEYLIVCNAGQGQAAGAGVHTGFFSRVARSFDVVHRRVQDAAMRRLHQLREAGQIKGFVLPYLGQLDRNLPMPLGRLVPREEVIEYPTDFAAMSEDWIRKLTDRGEQLTRCLVEFYLKDIL